MRFKNFLGGLLVALASVVSFGAHAEQTQWKTLAPDLRAIEYSIPQLIVDTASVATKVVGQNDIVVIGEMWSGSAAYATISISAINIAPFAYPQRFNIFANDRSTNTAGAITCSSVVVRGNGPNGLANPPEYFALTETAQLSTYSYEQITSVEASGCAGATGADDDLMIYGSTWVYPGVPARVNAGVAIQNASAQTYHGSSNIISVCARYTTGVTQGTQWYCAPGYLFEFHSASNTINLAQTWGAIYNGQTTTTMTGIVGAPIGVNRSPHLIRARASLW